MADKDSNQHRPPEYTPPVLDYNSGKDQPVPDTSTSGQMLAGFLCWVLAVVATFVMLPAQSGITPPDLWWIPPALMLGLVIAACIWTRVKFGWRGFVPGVLIGLGLTCLVPIGIIAVICGGNFGKL
jgi:hypothetical protein